MNRLVIPLKGEYFDAIQRGDKTEEYRLYNDYWIKRLEGRDYDELVLTRGYPTRGDESRRMYFAWAGYTIKTITHPHFGPEQVKVFAIRVGREFVSELDLMLAKNGMDT